MRKGILKYRKKTQNIQLMAISTKQKFISSGNAPFGNGQNATFTFRHQIYIIVHFLYKSMIWNIMIELETENHNHIVLTNSWNGASKLIAISYFSKERRGGRGREEEEMEGILPSKSTIPPHYSRIIVGNRKLDWKAQSNQSSFWSSSI